MVELYRNEINSPELQEVLSEIPGTFLRWGLILFFGIILLIIGMTWFINYPTIVSVPISITTYNSPASIVARSSGKIETFFVENGGEVIIDQPIALISSKAKWHDIETITRFLNSLIDTIGWKKKVTEKDPPNSLSLGSIQSEYSKFLKSYGKFRKYIKLSFIPTKIELIEKEILMREDYVDELNVQHSLSVEDLKSCSNSFHRDSDLFEYKPSPISINQSEKSRQTLLQKQVSYSNLKSNIKNNELLIIKLRESILDLKSQYENEMNLISVDLDQSIQLLKAAIEQWEEKYLLESPIAGRVAYTSIWGKNQDLKAGNIVAAVIPREAGRIIIRANIPASEVGKVKTGQNVNIKLTSLSNIELGNITGKVKSLLLVTEGESYVAEIDLINGMNSFSKIEINSIREIKGTADIIIGENKLIYKIFKPSLVGI
jgi:hypothetical protein